MANPFDALGAVAFGTVSTTFGHDASWAPSGGGTTLTARVCFLMQAVPGRVGEVGPAPIEPVFEYLKTDLPGLYASVRGGTEETVTIDGTAYTVADVEPVEGGALYLARLAAV